MLLLLGHHRRGRASPPTTSGFGHDVFVPVVDKWIPLGPGWYVLLFLIIAGAANGVNLTDGLDGLAAGHVDHRARDVHRDGGDDLHPLGDAARTAGSRTGSTPRSSARR